MSTLRPPLRIALPRPGTLIRMVQAWLLERRRRRNDRHIEYLTAHRDEVDRTLGWLYRERSKLAIARIELDRLP